MCFHEYGFVVDVVLLLVLHLHLQLLTAIKVLMLKRLLGWDLPLLRLLDLLVVFLLGHLLWSLLEYFVGPLCCWKGDIFSVKCGCSLFVLNILFMLFEHD